MKIPANLKYAYTSNDIIKVNESKNTVLLEEAKTEIRNDEGSEQEVEELTAYSFIDSWDENVVLEIIASNVTVKTDLMID